MGIRISAIIPTYNRAKYLSKAIQSLVDQTLPIEQYEILVIDNCSTDRTRQIVCEDFAHVSNLRYIYEPVLGLNQARNTGWKQACGEYIAYLDDDAIASPQWLEKIVETFETILPMPGCVGGKVVPIWEAPRPAWLDTSMDGLLTILDLSEMPLSLEEGQWLVGANIAFPRALLEQLDGFLIGLDRMGKKLLSNGEILMEQRVRQQCLTLHYDPAISVRHLVPAARLTQQWFIRRLYWQGASNAIIEIHQTGLRGGQRLRLGLYRLRRFLQSQKQIASLVLQAATPDDFAIKCKAFSQVGEIMALLGVAS